MTQQHARGVELIRRGLYCGRRKEMESGVLCLIQGLAQIDTAADPRLTLCALHNLALFLCQLGTLVLARAVIQRAKLLYQEVDDPIMLARADWLEGTIARLSGRYARARKKLAKALESLSRLDLRLAEDVEEELALLEIEAGERAA